MWAYASKNLIPLRLKLQCGSMAANEFHSLKTEFLKRNLNARHASKASLHDSTHRGIKEAYCTNVTPPQWKPDLNIFLL